VVHLVAQAAAVVLVALAAQEQVDRATLVVHLPELNPLVRLAVEVQVLLVQTELQVLLVRVVQALHRQFLDRP
jgi:hypothetical protein